MHLQQPATTLQGRLTASNGLQPSVGYWSGWDNNDPANARRWNNDGFMHCFTVSCLLGMA